MNNLNDEISMRFFTSLRKIIQAMDKHSSYLKKEFGITSSQLIILQKVFEVDTILVSRLAKQISLSQATGNKDERHFNATPFFDFLGKGE